MLLKNWIVKDLGLICFIAITLAIGIGLYRFFESKEKQAWNMENGNKQVNEVVKLNEP